MTDGLADATSDSSTNPDTGGKVDSSADVAWDAYDGDAPPALDSATIDSADKDTWVAIK